MSIKPKSIEYFLKQIAMQLLRIANSLEALEELYSRNDDDDDKPLVN